MWLLGKLQRERKSRPGVKRPPKPGEGRWEAPVRRFPAPLPGFRVSSSAKHCCRRRACGSKAGLVQTKTFCLAHNNSPDIRFCLHHPHWSVHVRTKKHVQVVLFDLHMRKVGQREALLTGVKRGLAPLAGCGAAPCLPQNAGTDRAFGLPLRIIFFLSGARALCSLPQESEDRIIPTGAPMFAQKKACAGRPF